MSLYTFASLKDFAGIPVSKPTFFRYVDKGLVPPPFENEAGAKTWTGLQAVFLKEFFKDLKYLPTITNKKTKVVSVCLQKGGVGKTSLTINLATALAFRDRKVLIIDADQQASASLYLGARVFSIEDAMLFKEHPNPSIFDVLFEEKDPAKVITHKAFDIRSEDFYKQISLDILPSGSEMAQGETFLMNEVSRHDRFKQLIIEPLSGYYDYILIDCPPSLSLITMNALYASDALVIPMMPTAFAFDGLFHLFRTISSIQSKTKGLNHPLVLAGVAILNKSQTIAQESTCANIAKVFGNKVFTNVVPARTLHQESELQQTPIISYTSDVGKAYLGIADEFIQRIEGLGPASDIDDTHEE